MNDSDFSPQEQELINRLERAPQPDLSPDAFEAIRARILDGMDSLPIDNTPPRLGRPVWSAPVVTAIAAVLIVAIGVSVLLFNRPDIAVTPTPIQIIMPTFTPAPTAMIPPTVTVPAITPTVEITATQPTLQAVTPDSTPEISLTPTLAALIVIEGPVQAINANVVTIYGIDITLNPDDPLLPILAVGDVLHIEADYDSTGMVIIAVTVETVSSEIIVNPATNESWRDDGGCNNPPPPWAPANGWRRRCENAGSPNSGNGNNGNNNGNNGNNGNGNNGNRNGNGRDDDDD